MLKGHRRSRRSADSLSPGGSARIPVQRVRDLTHMDSRTTADSIGQYIDMLFAVLVLVGVTIVLVIVLGASSRTAASSSFILELGLIVVTGEIGSVAW
jgi:hypothetical protein